MSGSAEEPSTHETGGLSEADGNPVGRPTRSSGPRAAGWRLSPKARRAVVVMLVVAVVAVPLSYWIGRHTSDAATHDVVVGGDLHALFSVGGRNFISGHGGASYADGLAVWTPISDLEGKDAMGWASTSDGILVGGHGGLFRSRDGGETFTADDAMPAGTDVHALGSARDTVYLSTPAEGVFVSTDGGATFTPRRFPLAIIGTILVNPANPSLAIAADLKRGAIQTNDEGRSWHPLGGPVGAMSVAWNPQDRRGIVVIGAKESAISRDAGRSWAPLKVPPGTATAAYTPAGWLVVGLLHGGSAQVYRLGHHGWDRVG